MAKTRALLTDTDREYITGEHGNKRRYESAARIRARINEELPHDIDILREHHPDLYNELRDVVCK